MFQPLLDLLPVINVILGFIGYFLFVAVTPKAFLQKDKAPRELMAESWLLISIILIIVVAVGYRIYQLFCKEFLPTCYFYYPGLISFSISVAFVLLGYLLARFYYGKTIRDKMDKE